MSATKDGGAAFPMSSGLLALVNGALEASNLSDEEKKRAGDRIGTQAFGMSLRDYFAAKAMAGELASAVKDADGAFGLDIDLADANLQRLAAHWYRIADAMLTAREGGAS